MLKIAPSKSFIEPETTQLCYWSRRSKLALQRRFEPHYTQNVWGCKGPLEVIWPYHPPQARPPRAGSPGLHNLPRQPVPELSHSDLSYFFTEPQNHRMLGVGRDFWRSSSPTLLPKQGYLQQVAQDLAQAGFEYLQRRRLHNLPGQPVPVLRHPQIFLMFRWNFPCISLCLLPLVLSLGTTENSLAPSSWYPPLR